VFKLDRNMKFINIDSDYIKMLNQACPEVYYKSIGYENKPYIGILINEENRSYVIPLTAKMTQKIILCVKKKRFYYKFKNLLKITVNRKSDC